jgi:signal transduction histidine kinase/ActR/RegA family two-component response regulator
MSNARSSAVQPNDLSLLDTFVSLRAAPRQRLIAGGLCLSLTAVTLGLLPFAGNQMPNIPGFLILNEALLILVYGITTWLLLAQYDRTRSLGLLVLAAGSLYTSLVVAMQMACFPNIFAPGILIGQGSPTLLWLWNFWHIAPPLFAMQYAFVNSAGPQRPLNVRQASNYKIAAIAMALLSFAATAILVTRFVTDLPTVSDADGLGYRALIMSGVGPAILAFTTTSLVILCWKTQLRSTLQLCLALSLYLLLLDNIITYLGAARATTGWFVGRAEALISAFVVLAVYLKEIDQLYRRAEDIAFSREQARREAQTARQNLEVALEASGMGEWELDITNGHMRRNLRHDRLFGYTELQNVWTLQHLFDRVISADRESARTAFTQAFTLGKLILECRIHKVDDQSVRWLAFHGRTSADDFGQPITMAGCVMDVTDRRLTDERLRQAERMEAIGQLTGGVAHDFNNLLTIMLGSLDMIARRKSDPERVERLATSALAAGRRGVDLTDKLLAFARRTVTEAETANINHLITDLFPLLQQALGEAINLDLSLDPSLDPALLDQQQFQAALLNLAGNSRDAMPSGGTFSITTENTVVTNEDLANVAEGKAGRFLKISVADTGTGMHQQTLERAFEPFYTTKEVGKGTGLGLSQVYGFAHQTGGFCRIKSEVGQGCVIEIYLPQSAGAASTTSKERDNVMPFQRAINGEVVLIVEDEDGVREIACESLHALGYGVMTAPDARIALDILRSPTRIDVLFSDIVMPGGMNGAQLAKEATQIRPALKVLLTSGYIATATGGVRELPKGVPLLRKPYMREDLAAKLQSIITHSQTA